MRLRPLDVVLRGVRVDHARAAELVEEELEVVLARGAGDDERPPTAAQLREQLACSVEGLALVPHRLELLRVRVPKLVAPASLDVVAGDGGDVLVAAHADVAME